MPAEGKDVYLTFDDGPVPGPTDFVLDELRRAGVSGTFFCIGDNVRKHPTIFSRITNDGHAIGNHTFHHLNGWKTSTADYVQNIEMNQNLMVDAGAGTTPLFRPPYGRITPAQVRALKAYRIVMWDVLSRDFDNRLSPDTCLKETRKAIRPGSIVVFHDSHKAEKNMQYTLPRLLDALLSSGYSFKTLSA